MRLRLVVVFLASLGLGTGSAVQPPPPGMPSPGPPGSQGQATPPRAGAPGPGEAPATGTAILRGIVVAADTGEPVRRAIVRALGPGTSGVTSTDAEGRFEIRDLAAGRYSLSASKGGYVSIQHGQRRPGQSGTPIDLRDGELMEKIQIALPPGSVITGRIFDDFGDPVSGVTVSAMQYRSVSGVRRLVMAGGEGGTARTDDQGGFRVYGLAPGDYIVSASSQNMSMMMPATRDDTPGAVSTYYPGTVNPGEAAHVRVQLGQETAGISFAMVIARMARVSGRAVSSSGEPVRGAMVMVTSTHGPLGPMGARGRPTDPDGTFTLTNVAPGDYMLRVRPMAPGGPGAEAAFVPVSVGAGDIEDLLITTRTGGTARGRIVTDTGAAPPFETSAVQLGLNPLQMGTMLMSNPVARVEDDWTFEVTGLFEPRVVRGGVRDQAWTLKAVRLDGRDVTDAAIDFGPGQTVDDIEVVFTDKLTSLEGTVTDDRGEPVVDATLIVFPGDSELWTPMSRYLRTSRPDQSGRYQFRSLPPHRDYRIVAVREVADDETRDPEFLATVRDQALRFSLAEGERKVQELRLTGGQ
ncbi:MAG: carboxypeptidase-like regulatory domain-containing protein [Vicinamibacterales bacterium]|nr:carboxypeptidase-like regulatory domain-containing protein [Vicinamibacterales bacterium]